MGAYPQGNRRARLHWLMVNKLIDDCPICKLHRGCHRVWNPPRPDRYKSRYRIQRRFKSTILAEIREHERLMNCIDDLFDEAGEI